MDLWLQARVDKFPLFQKNKDDDPKKKSSEDTWIMVVLKGVMHSVEQIVKSDDFVVLECSFKS